MTVVMGIVNVTPDSFSDGGRHLDAGAAIAHGLRLRIQGADVVDVGGESTRPGAERVSADVETSRILPVIRALAGEGVPVSVDTLRASTALAAVDAGARIVNDVSGGLADPEMLAAVAATDAEYVIGHWRGHSADMYAKADYADVVSEVTTELRRRLDAAAEAGIAPSRVIVDPGIGFGKRGADNWTLLRGLTRVAGLGPRVLVGTSRKRFLDSALGEALGAALDSALGADAPPARRDLATAVTSVLAVQAGAWGVRVHDVAATRDALLVEAAWRGES